MMEMEYTTLDKISENLDSKRKPITSSDRVEGKIPYYGASGIVDYVKDYIFDESLLLVSEDGANLLARSTPIAFSVTGKTWINNHAHVLRFSNENLQKFVEIYLNSISLESYVTGSAQPKLNQKVLNGIPIPVVDDSQIEIIVNSVENLKSIIELRKQELACLDDLIKARFVEMFGDESNPMGWPVLNVEDVASVSVGVVIKPAQYYTDAEHGTRAFRSLNIGPMKIKNTDWVYFSEEGNEKNSKSILKENDLIIVRSGAPGIACVVTKEYEGCNAIDIIIAHPDTSKVNPYYLCVYTNLPHGKRQIDEGTGGAAQQHFNVGKYNKLSLFLPPVEKQNEYVKFLDQVDKSKVVVASVK